MATFVLIHGAWHGAWCWERVVPLLEQRGHRAIAPDLPGLGEDRTPLRDLTLETWTRFVSGVVESAGEPVVLVGHSRGGIVISEVAERVPHAIGTLVYLAAFLVPNEETLAAMLTLSPARPVAAGAVVMNGDGVSSTIAPGKVGPVFYNTTDRALQERATRSVSPEPMMSFAAPVRTSATRFGKVRRAYIECLQDNAIPIELQRLMREALPCDPVVTLDTDHSPFYSAPAQLADALDGIARGGPSAK
jgi:pimeloyl-ACP methyl ester carboxylesterase